MENPSEGEDKHDDTGSQSHAQPDKDIDSQPDNTSKVIDTSSETPNSPVPLEPPQAPLAPVIISPADSSAPPVSPAISPPPPPPAAVVTPVTSAPSPPAEPPQSTNAAGVIIMEWLTYAFWGWTVLILSILTGSVFNRLINGGSSSDFNYYIISAAVVLLPISLVCDYFYAKEEPKKKTGAAMVVMVIHAVIFALLGIGALIFAVFSVVSLITSSNNHSSQVAGLLSAIIITIFYAATFIRALNPVQFSWIDRVYKIFMLVLVGIFIILGFTKPTFHSSTIITVGSPPYGGSDSGGGSTADSVEQLNQQGTRRPVQYVHICATSNGIVYYSQGSPDCLGSDTLETANTGTEAGTGFSSPCKTTSGKLRYVYISNNETCPDGTTILFYNSLGGSTSGPSSSSSGNTNVD